MRMRSYSFFLTAAVLINGCQLQSYGKSKLPEATAKGPTLVQTMHGYVSKCAALDPISSCIDEAMGKAIEQSTEAQKHAKNVKHFSHKVVRAIKVTKDITNYMLCDRGFLPSIEGGKILLDEDCNVKSKNSAEYAKQHWLDATHDRVVSDVVELATALGVRDAQRRAELTKSAMDSLSETSGEATATHIYDTLVAWNEKLGPRFVDPQTSWSLKERQSKVKLILDSCLSVDPVANEVTNRVHKYSQKKKATVVGSQVVETALNAVSLSPTFIGPAAQAALLVFFMATGGCEEDKLISEIYLGKRLQSRKASLQQQAALAVDAYQFGILTGNTALMACSESLVRRLGGPDLYVQVFGNEAKVAPAATPAAVSQPGLPAQISAAPKQGT